jgi:hypothetical protein
MTRVAFPPESLFDLYVQSRASVVSYTFAEGDLMLALSDGPIMVFAATVAQSQQGTAMAG